jgi:hypothetical protein
MPSGPQLYTRKVMNRSGNILEFPDVPSMSAFYDASATLDPYAISLAQGFPLGTGLTRGERKWRYFQNGAGTPGAGTVMQGVVVHHAANDIDLVVDATTAAGAYTISLTSTANAAVAADYYKEGYAFVNVGTGLGNYYKIKSHQAMVSTTAGSIFTLFDPLVLASTAGNTKWGMRKNPYDAILASTAAMTGQPVGITMCTLVASYFGWVQTKGPCAVLAHAAIAASGKAMAGTTAAQIDPSVDNEAALAEIGWVMSIPDTAGEACLVYLTIE